MTDEELAESVLARATATPRDPIMRHLERQDEYWRANPRDEEITYRPGWDERWELMLEETQ